MSQHNIHLLIKYFPEIHINIYICFLSYWKNFRGTQKTSLNSHVKHAISVRVIKFFSMFPWKNRQNISSCQLKKALYSELCNVYMFWWINKTNINIFYLTTQKHAYIILIPLNPTFIL